MTLIKENFVNFPVRVLTKVSLNLRYRTGEKVPVKERVEILVEIGEFSIKLSAFVVADMVEDCLLGIDFLSEIKFDTFCDFFFKKFPCKKETLVCSRVADFMEEIPSFLRELFKKETKGLKEIKKINLLNF